MKRHTDAYTTIKTDGFGDYREKGSKFISKAFHCASEEELKAEIAALKKKHSAARHFCYGAVLGSEASEERSNDDGEPSGTAGLPILNQILSEGLSNVGVVVVRYFGGSKLGKPGLIHAYKSSAEDSINQSIKSTHFNSKSIYISYPYDVTTAIMTEVQRHPFWQIEDQQFNAQCLMKLGVPNSEFEVALSSFTHVPSADISTIPPHS